jgi:hypothetical protein
MEISDEEIVEALNAHQNDQMLIDALEDHENAQQGGSQIYRVTSTFEKKNAKFKIKTKTINLVMSTVAASFQSANEQVNALFTQIYDDYIKPLNSNTKVRIVVFHELFNYPCSTHLIDKDQFTPYLISQLFSNTVQSRVSSIGSRISRSQIQHENCNNNC